jgi:hypothetical protein
MRYSVVALSALATAAMGQNSTSPYTFPAGFNIGLVDSSDRSEYLRDSLT